MRKLGAANRRGLIHAERTRSGSNSPFEGEQPPFVGRSAELGRLERWWLGDPANTGLVVVFSWAGVGKTGLLHRFAGRVAASDVPVL